MKDWLNLKVKTIKEMDCIPIGSIGEVTADLPEDDVFAVWFEDIDLNPPWITFNHNMKEEYFEVCG